MHKGESVVIMLDLFGLTIIAIGLGLKMRWLGPGTIEEKEEKRISFYCTMLVAGLVGCVRDDRMKGQEKASFRL